MMANAKLYTRAGKSASNACPLVVIDFMLSPEKAGLCRGAKKKAKCCGKPTSASRSVFWIVLRH